MAEWQSIETAPKGETDILVWFDHDADPYQDPEEPNKLTAYAAWADGGDFLNGRGWCIARWFPQFSAWFARENNDWERVVNPTHWMPLPDPPNA